MSQAVAGPEWTRNGSCRPRYIWHTQNGQLQTGKFNQAARITLAKRQPRGKGSRVEPKLYACKWYPTVGLSTTDPSGSSISGLKYVQREAATFASINHPNIVRFQDFSYELGGAQLAKLYMDYCPYGDLSQFVRRPNDQTDPRMNPRKGIQVFSQLAEALLYLHHGVFKTDVRLELGKLDFGVFKVEGQSQEVSSVFKEFESAQDLSDWKTIIHRDVKPANVFISELTDSIIQVKLGDFGLAKFETEGSNSYVGSRDYFAPEQRTASVNQRTTFKSDIYALGLTVKEITQLDTPNSSPTELCMDRLISRCVMEDDLARPSSGAIIDELRPHLSIARPMDNMLLDVVNRVLGCETEGNTNKRRKLKMELADSVLLCRRLLDLGSNPNLRGEGQSFMLDLTVAFLNNQMETLDELQTQRSSTCPPWKTTIVEELAKSLRDRDGIGVIRPYDIGQRTFQSFCTESKHRRSEILINVLSPTIGTMDPRIKSKITAELAKNYGYVRLLRFTADKVAFAAEVTKLEATATTSSNSANTAAGWGSDTSSAMTGFSMESTSTEDHIRSISESFKQFANSEKLRLRLAQEQKRTAQRAEKSVKLHDLKKFAENFTLNTRVPNDLVPLMAKDLDKQRAIQQKADEAYEREKLRVDETLKQELSQTPKTPSSYYNVPTFPRRPASPARPTWSEVAKQRTGR